jgi:GMP synthase-like glutamine amidotransferase
MRAHVLQHVPFEGLGSIEPWLHRAGASVTATRFFERVDLPDVDTVDLLIVMGGPMSVNDDQMYPWLAAERQFVRRAIGRGAAVLGVCLGAQVIARAMGARVYPNVEREIGWFPITGVSNGAKAPAWAAAGVDTTVFHWHGETFDLPAGAIHLARSAGCEHQAFQLGQRVVGIQFHLETTAMATQAMVAHCRGDLAPSRFVQSESDILAPDASRFAAIHACMSDTLDRLTGAETSRD